MPGGIDNDRYFLKQPLRGSAALDESTHYPVILLARPDISLIKSFAYVNSM
jgi:hypothetical protein